jgi:hypothetical protein
VNHAPGYARLPAGWCWLQELSLSTSGRNWGGVAINGKSLMFMVDGKVAFEVPLPDVAQVGTCAVWGGLGRHFSYDPPIITYQMWLI